MELSRKSVPFKRLIGLARASKNVSVAELISVYQKFDKSLKNSMTMTDLESACLLSSPIYHSRFDFFLAALSSLEAVESCPARCQPRSQSRTSLHRQDLARNHPDL